MGPSSKRAPVSSLTHASRRVAGPLVDHQENDGATALLMAALNRCVEAVGDLLDHGTDIDHTNQPPADSAVSAAWYPVG